MPAPKKLEILICDDEKAVEQSIKARLPKKIAANVRSVPPDQIQTEVALLKERIAEARKPPRSRKNSVSRLDGVDILIVDYDLIAATKAEYFTGETLAYLARCYSRCGVIVALNQFTRSTSFDLTLRSELDSFADINISIDDIGNHGLWFAKSWPRYRPWSWPILPDLSARLRKRLHDLRNIDASTRIADFFEFPTSAVERIPTSAWETLAPGRKEAALATFEDVINSPTLGFRGRESLDRKTNPEQDARIIALRLGAWLASILWTQDVLVDTAHLATRCPSILGHKRKIADFNSLAILGSAKFSKSRALANVKFKKSHWLDRPAWFWTEIERQRLLKEVLEPWEKRPVDFVFCEDTSKFSKRTDAKPFQSDLLTSYRTRFVEQVPKIEYRPLQRLALG